MFKKNYPLLTAVLLAAITLAGCSTPASSSRRSDHHYVYGKTPQTTTQSASVVAPVVAQTRKGTKGPDNVAHIVYFDFDSYAIRPSDRSIIEGHARWMRSNPSKSLMLQGHTDIRGGIEYNLALGQKRAEAVRKGLEMMGVEHRRIEAVSYGKERLVDTGTSEEAHQRNRRVEFEYR